MFAGQQRCRPFIKHNVVDCKQHVLRLKGVRWCIDAVFFPLVQQMQILASAAAFDEALPNYLYNRRSWCSLKPTHPRTGLVSCCCRAACTAYDVVEGLFFCMKAT
jgi:hypothetical protein